MQQDVERLRRFNRFYTRRLGILDKGFLGSDFALIEVRVLYELAHRDNVFASELVDELTVDPGYLSRILRGFEQQGLIRKQRSRTDSRRSMLALTAKGRRVFERLDKRQHDEVAAMLQDLHETDRRRLLAAAGAVEDLLERRQFNGTPFVLRDPRPGDIGWVVERHGAIYSMEYGWNEQFEALVAEIAGGFLKQHDAEREHCWIAELDGRNAGCIFLVAKDASVAQLRLLLVEPDARGLGIGRALIRRCIEFARTAGYRKITLWTNHVLEAARHLYEEAGFTLLKEEPHERFGTPLVGQTWELRL